MDVSKMIVAKSDQLNADDLVGGPITVRIEGLSKGKDDQPLSIKISGGHQPWKPCKTCIRLLVEATKTTNATEWVGMTVRLYRDPDVKWAGEKVGGIRISGLSCLEKPIDIKLQETRGKKLAYHIEPIAPLESQHEPANEPPDNGLVVTIDDKQFATIMALIDDIVEPNDERRKGFIGGMLKFAGASGISKIPASRYEDVVTKLQEKKLKGID